MAPCTNCSIDETWYVCEIPYWHWKAWMGLRATVRAAKPENHIYCSYSKQAATNTQVLILMRSWMLCLLPKWLLEYFVGFALLGQKLTSRFFTWNIYSGMWVGESLDEAIRTILLLIIAGQWHHFQNARVPWGNSPTSHRTVLSFELLARCSMKSYFVPTRFQTLWSSGSYYSLHHLGHISPPNFLTSTQS